jgi:hypothetical protein
MKKAHWGQGRGTVGAPRKNPLRLEVKPEHESSSWYCRNGWARHSWAVCASDRRVAPVAPLCSPEAQTLEVDSVGVEDRGVSRSEPKCKPGQNLVVDAFGEGDGCLAQGSVGGPESGKTEGKKPTCRGGLELKVRSGKDLCERVERPRCPSGFKPKARPGPDGCMP